MREQKGITLIALVITIIVLLILAGVTIAMLTGQNGILTNAQNAKTSTLQSEAEERINMTLNAIKTEIFSQQVTNKNYSGTTTTDSVTTVDSRILEIMKLDLSNSLTSKDAIGQDEAANEDYSYNLGSDGKLTIMYKSEKGNFYTYGDIVLTSTTNNIAITAATSTQIADN